MKKIFITLALCAAVSCTSKIDNAREGAQNFLDAFLANDFNAAAACCTEDFQSDFNETIQSYVNLDESVRTILQEECSKYSAEIISVERVNESDTFQVNYNIVRTSPDSTQIKKGTISSTLIIVDGKVDKLNK